MALMMPYCHARPICPSCRGRFCSTCDAKCTRTPLDWCEHAPGRLLQPALRFPSLPNDVWHLPLLSTVTSPWRPRPPPPPPPPPSRTRRHRQQHVRPALTAHATHRRSAVTAPLTTHLERRRHRRRMVPSPPNPTRRCRHAGRAGGKAKP